MLSIPSGAINCEESRDFNFGHRGFAVGFLNSVVRWNRGCLVSGLLSASCVFLFWSWLLCWVICESSMVTSASIPSASVVCLAILNPWSIFSPSCCVDGTGIWGNGLPFFTNVSGTFFCSPSVLTSFWAFSSSCFCVDDRCMVLSIVPLSKTLFLAAFDAPIWKFSSVICWTNGVITGCCIVPLILKWLSGSFSLCLSSNDLGLFGSFFNTNEARS